MICLIGLLVASPFGIFFSGEDSGTGYTMPKAVSTLNQGFTDRIEQIKAGHPHDKLDLDNAGNAAMIANWRDVLAIYAVKTTTDEDSPDEVATLTEQKLTILREILWDMNDISYREETVSGGEDGEDTVILQITVTVKSAAQMANAYHFTAEQRKLLEELLGRYQRAEQAELSQGQRAQVEALVGEKLSGSQRPRRRWPWVLAALAVVWAGWSVFSRLDRMDGQYNSLANSVNNVSHSVNAQVGSIASRVEEILKAQNDLTADYATQLVSADLAENTVRFSLRAVPKTYTPGMSVVFLADSGGEVREMEAAEEENGAFTGEMVCPLTDSITLSAVFVTGNTRQTQLLDQYQGLYQDSFPQVEPMDLSSVMYSKRGKNGRFALPEGYVTVGGERASVPVVNEALGVSRLREVRVGLFHNFKLVTWLEPCEKPDSFEGFAGQDFYRLDPMELDLAEGDDLAFAAVVTDEYGRRWVSPSIPEYQVQDGEILWPEESVVYQKNTLADWGLE